MFSHLDQNPSIQIQMRMGLKGRRHCLFVDGNGFSASYRNIFDRTSLKDAYFFGILLSGQSKYFPIQYFFPKCADARRIKVQGLYRESNPGPFGHEPTVLTTSPHKEMKN